MTNSGTWESMRAPVVSWSLRIHFEPWTLYHMLLSRDTMYVRDVID
jgi:hypothetical protein